MVDALVSGASVERRAGSSPVLGTKRGCIKIKFFGTPSLFMLPENLIKQSRLFFGDNLEISDSRDAKYDKNAKSGRIGAIFPRFWPVVLFLNTFS